MGHLRLKQALRHANWASVPSVQGHFNHLLAGLAMCFWLWQNISHCTKNLTVGPNSQRTNPKGKKRKKWLAFWTYFLWNQLITSATKKDSKPKRERWARARSHFLIVASYNCMATWESRWDDSYFPLCAKMEGMGAQYQSQVLSPEKDGNEKFGQLSLSERQICR